MSDLFASQTPAASTGDAGVPALTGTLLHGTYRVGRLLGRGGMGAVFEGVHEQLGRPIAIKVLLDRSLGEADLARFAREARSAAALGHPNIVQVTDFQHRPPEPPFLVMERLVGQSLRAAIAEGGPLPAPRAASIGSQMLDALAAAHRAGLVHRDVKPDNVFLTQVAGVGDVVKLLDFGIAKVVGDATLTASGAMMGSPAYMAPEQATGGAVDARTDIYGVGVTLYHALTGKLPFDAKSLPELLVCILQAPPRPLLEVAPWLDPALASAVERAMAKDPAARFPSAEAMRAVIEPIARGQAPHAPPQASSFVAGPSPAPSQAPSFAASGAFVPATPASPAPRGSSAGLWIALAAGALVLLGAIGGGAAYFVLGSSGSEVSGPTAVSAPPNTTEATPVPTIAASAPPSPESAPTSHGASASAPSRGAHPSGGTASTATSHGAGGTTATPSGPAATTAAAAQPTTTKGAHATCSPSQYGPYPSSDGIKAALASRAAAITGCAPLACFQHDKSRDTGYDFEVYAVTVDASGAARTVGHPGDSCAKLDACVLPVIKTMQFGPTSTPGEIRFSCGYFE